MNESLQMLLERMRASRAALADELNQLSARAGQPGASSKNKRTKRFGIAAALVLASAAAARLRRRRFH